MYVQAIPLYTTADTGPSTYFIEHRDELDAITGTAVVMAFADTVFAGNDDDIGRMLDAQQRFRGLKRADLPCLWVEAQQQHFVLRLPGEHDAIKRLLRRLADAAGTAHTIKELELAMTDQRNPAPDPERKPESVGDKTAFLSMFALLLVFAGLLIWQIPRIHQYNLGVFSYLVYFFAALLAAFVLFKTLDSSATIKGMKFGVAIEVGGAAALFLIVLLIGLSHHNDERLFTAKFYIVNNAGSRIRQDGQLELRLNHVVSVDINKGSGVIELDGGWREKTVAFDLDIAGWKPTKAASVQLGSDQTEIFVEPAPPITISAGTAPPPQPLCVSRIVRVVDVENVAFPPLTSAMHVAPERFILGETERTPWDTQFNPRCQKVNCLASGFEYDTALYVHPRMGAQATITVPVTRCAEHFTARVGISEYEASRDNLGTVEFMVLAGSNVLARTTAAERTEGKISVPIPRGSSVLRLIANSAGTEWSDHATWANALIYEGEHSVIPSP
jgi:hypothetical protein